MDLAAAAQSARRAAFRTAFLKRAPAAPLIAGLLLLCAVPGGDPSPAHASVVQALSLPQLTYKADEIVVAQALSQRARRHIDGKLIVTDVTLAVREVLKGRAKPGGTTVATVLGGKLDGLALQVPGEASFRNGERALVFLYRAPHSGDLRVVGMSQGLLPLREQAGTWTVLPGGAGAALVDREKAPDGQPAEPAVSEPQALADVVRRIRALVAQQSK